MNASKQVAAEKRRPNPPLLSRDPLVFRVRGRKPGVIIYQMKALNEQKAVVLVSFLANHVPFRTTCLLSHRLRRTPRFQPQCSSDHHDGLPNQFTVSKNVIGETFVFSDRNVREKPRQVCFIHDGSHQSRGSARSVFNVPPNYYHLTMGS